MYLDKSETKLRWKWKRERKKNEFKMSTRRGARR